MERQTLPTSLKRIGLVH